MQKAGFLKTRFTCMYYAMLIRPSKDAVVHFIIGATVFKESSMFRKDLFSQNVFVPHTRQQIFHAEIAKNG